MKTFTQPLSTLKNIMAGMVFSAGLALSTLTQAQLTPQTEGVSMAPKVSAIELAYKKELAFLQAQKHNLQGRLTRLLQDTNDQFDVEKINILHLEEEVIASNNLVQLDKSVLLDDEDNGEIFAATFLQADASLEKYLGSLENDKAFQKLSDGKKITELFTRSTTLLNQLSSVYQKQGDFHLLDGSKVTGEIIHLGNVARFGLATLKNGDQVGGMLAPAGEGLFTTGGGAGTKRKNRHGYSSVRRHYWLHHCGLWCGGLVNGVSPRFVFTSCQPRKCRCVSRSTPCHQSW